MRFRIAALALIAGLFAAPAMAQNSYKIVASAALTGPGAGTYAPAMEGLRIYIDKLNAAGGIGGRKIDLEMADDAGEPSKAAANARRFMAQDGVLLFINASFSSTYPPVLAEARRAKVPVLFASSVCPKETFPTADEGQFCTTGWAQNYDSRVSLAFLKDAAKTPAKVALVGTAIPISRAEIEYAETQLAPLGLGAGETAIIPPPTADYTPYATKIKDTANWAYAWAPWVTTVRTLEALRRLGWEGSMVATANPETETDMARLKDEKLFIVSSNSMLQDGLPIHREILAAAQAGSGKYPAPQIVEGWVAGMVVDAALRATGWPASAEKLRAAMSNLKVDLKGLRGGTHEWTAANHFRTKQYYRLYRWDNKAGKAVIVRDWFSYDIN
jgi:branched-chain amino acid transport system substrate-binding protein